MHVREVTAMNATLNMILNKSIEYDDLGTYDAATDQWVKPKGKVNEGMRTARSRASTIQQRKQSCCGCSIDAR